MDDAKARREMRRRKILENSEKRLQNIARCKLEDGNTDKDLTHLLYSGIGENTSIDPAKTLYHDERLRDNTNSSFSEFAPANQDDRVNTPLPSSVFIPKNGRFKIWKKLGFKLVILAVVVRLVHIFKLGYLFGQTVAVPFALFMMTQLGSCQFEQNVVGIAGPVLFFIGVSPNKIKNLLICYNVVTSILVYFAIYFFSFVVVHLICVTVFEL